MTDIWAAFSGNVTQRALSGFLGLMAFARNESASRIHIMMHSAGGDVGTGCALYELLATSPIPITAYNLGTVSSIAVVAYLGAAERVVAPCGVFMLHGPYNGGQSVNIFSLPAFTKALQIDDARMNAIIAGRTTLAPANIKPGAEYYFDHNDALTFGIATSIGHFMPPVTAKLFTIHSD